MKKMWQSGVNFFDTAEMYGSAGAGETRMGKAFKELMKELNF